MHPSSTLRNTKINLYLREIKKKEKGRMLFLIQKWNWALEPLLISLRQLEITSIRILVIIDKVTFNMGLISIDTRIVKGTIMTPSYTSGAIKSCMVSLQELVRLKMLWNQG